MRQAVAILLCLGVLLTPAAIHAQSASPSVDSIRAAIDRLLTDGERLRQDHSAAALDSAVGCYDSVRTLARALGRPGDSAIAAANFGSAICAHWMGQGARGDSLLGSALDAWTRLYGPDHPDNAAVRTFQAFMLPPLGQYAQAEELFRQAITVLEKNRAGHERQLATAQQGLGWLFLNLNRHADADSLFRLSLDTWRRSGCERCSGAGAAILELGITARETGRWADAEARLTDALAIFTDAHGPNHHLTGIAHSEVALLLVALRRYDEARPHLERSVAITEAAFGRQNSQLVQPLSRLADLEFHDGNLLAARDHYRRAQEITGNMGRTPDQPLDNALARELAPIEFLLGNTDASIACFQNTVASGQRFLREVFAHAPEDLKLWFVGIESPVSDGLLTLALDRKITAASTPAFEMLLGGKALVIDALAAERAAVYCSEDPALLELERRRVALCGEIATLTRSRDQSPFAGRAADSLAVLYHLKDSLETRLVEHCGEFRNANAAARPSVATVAAALPRDAALWEFVVYRPSAFVTDPDASQTGETRYGAFLLSADGSLATADLGPAAVIDSLIRLCRARLESFPAPSTNETDAEAELARHSAELGRRLFSPFATVLEHTGQLIVSPDGELSLLPFEILMLSDGHYAIERHQFSYVATGRDLLRAPEAPASRYAAVIADPDFDVAAPPLFAALDPGRPLTRSALRRGGECGQTRFWRLRASADEGEAVTRLLRDTMHLSADLFRGADASVARLENFPAVPRVLHIATHAFYCDESGATPAVDGIANPLLRCGLALAGANARMDKASDGGDGRLTAFELSGLNLVGNELTILSACQTGAGAIMRGEGVFGLRRALQHAGARTLVVSVFAVPDNSTGSIMQSFYRNWAAGLPKAAALRRAALDQLESVS